jgi:hypothetical protein
MRLALHAEWTKIRTVASPRWLLLGTIAVTVALSAGVTSVMTCGAAGCGGGDTAKLSLTGVELGQALVAILAAGVISGEYSSGMIRTTLTAMPHRATVLAAKAVTLTGVVAAAGTVAVLGSLLAGRLILPALPFPRHLPGNRRSALAAPAPADRADERRARHPGHHRSPQPAHRSMGRPRRPRRLGHHGAPDRRAAAPAARRVNASPRGANGKIL